MSTYNYIQLHHVIAKTNISPPAHKDKDYVEPPRGYNICHKNTHINKILEKEKKNVDVDKYQPGLWLFSSVIKILFTTFLQNYLEKTQRYPKNLKSNLVHQSLLLTRFHFKRQLKRNHVPNICSQCSCATLYRFSANVVDLKTY